MDAIKQIISTLAGEDICPANREKIIGLSEKLREALREWQLADLPTVDRVSIVLPDGFAAVTSIAVSKAVELQQEEPQENIPLEAPVPAPAAEPIASPVLFSVPRPPVTIRVVEPEPEMVVEAPQLPQPETIVWELPLPDAEEAQGPETEVFAVIEETMMHDEVSETIAPALEEDLPAILPLPIENKDEVVADLPPAMQMMEALMAAIPIPSNQVEADDLEPAPPLELAIDEEMLEEQLALEAEPEPVAIETPIPESIAPPSHAPYLPKSMQLEHMEELMVLPKPRPVAPVLVPEAAPSAQPVEVNERLQTRRRELSEVLQEPKIADLRKGISINERYQYIQNLFRADEAMFERSIKTLNSFNILAEAQYWMQRELVIKLGWNDEDELVQQFYQVVSRRFRSI